ncbi:response regulator transcription factor [Oceanirhabdus seepicola]|uniref:Stage 0 sporulation protein A homolog n=1 Tax=Oceanirhabdus seepicola TaxID=2828781 RepID=A0A9J6P1E9_9CLOT|nr:response regulator transcription factor [Oceanirhabdus seepicola]MCM1990363.1 response regulator transcription factor [Oceanirhabdus seepicola]
MNHTIIVIEDEFSINDALSFSLRKEGYEVISAYSSREAKKSLKEHSIDLALLDINLPDENGFELCKYINSVYQIPILMLTARNDIVDKVLGLELGADDYITKPFHIKEVLTRIKVALRRVQKYSNFEKEKEFLQLNENIKINLKSRRVLKNEDDIKLKPKEYDLLEFLVRNKERVFSRNELLDKVWGFDYEGEMRTVDTHIRRLRSKLDSESGQSIIETIFGIGYVLRNIKK